MNYAFIKNKKCENVGYFEVAPTSEFIDSVTPTKYDMVVVCPDGFGIGDEYDGATWQHGGASPLTSDEKIDALSTENKILKAQLQAQTDRSDFIEDCIAEMATQVYS
jgi:hypothetical protein